jgi:TonB-dependent receptor
MRQSRKRAAIWLALSGCFAGMARAEEAPLPTVVVSGQRASLDTARQLRRQGDGIVDAVVADDIDKLPDFSVNDAVQRVAGVQIMRDRGEASAVAIRGLTQLETTINGREIFSAGFTGSSQMRSVDFGDLPADMVAAIAVHKTGNASQLEGGVGGSVDLRTRRPFDFGKPALAATARTVHGDLVGGSAPQFSVLGTQRWQLGGGEFGALLSLSSQRRGWREDQKSSGNPLLRNDLVPGQIVVAPNGSTESASMGRRQREGANFALQWRPQPGLELYAEGSYAQFKTLQDTYQANAAASATFAPGSVSLFPGTNYLQGVTWTNASLSILSFARDTVNRDRQLAVGGSWQSGALTVKADLSRTTAYQNLMLSGSSLSASAAQFSQDWRSGIPATSYTFAAGDPTRYKYVNMLYTLRPFNGDLNAARLDAEWARPGSFLHTLAGGLRLARRGADNGSGVIAASAAANVAPGTLLDTLAASPAGSLFPGEGVPSLDGYLAGSLALARDPLALRRQLGVTAAVPASGAPAVWSFSERNTAAWLMGSLRAASLPLDGNVGLRAVHVRSEGQGMRAALGGGFAPVEMDSSGTDWLPSANLRYRPDGDGAWRAAVSRTMARPTFDQLQPSLTLFRNVINPAANTGTAGNPALGPVRSRNLDLAWERYLPGQGMFTATVFWKWVDGFVLNRTAPESYDGVSYQVTRPQNANPGRLKGAELSYQQFFDGLPEAWRGLGMQLNFTYVDSATPSAAVGADIPLQNLSRQSANAVLIYERGPWSARAAYNWRSRFLAGTATFAGMGTLPQYVAGYGWLDASLRYKLSERWLLALEGTNLSNTVRRAYFGVPERHQSSWMNDRQLAFSASYRY